MEVASHKWYPVSWSMTCTFSWPNQKSESLGQTCHLNSISLASLLSFCLCTATFTAWKSHLCEDLCPVSEDWTTTGQFSQSWGPQQVSSGLTHLQAGFPAPSTTNAKKWTFLAIIHLSPEKFFERGQTNFCLYLPSGKHKFLSIDYKVK